MKPTLPISLLLAGLLCSTFTLPLAAQGPGRGQKGRGHGGGGPGGPGGFQEAIHALFDNHTKIKRTVEMTETGYKSRTVSDDPEIAKTLQKHVREMRERLGAGLMIRRWDPAFAELVEHYEDIEHNFKEVDGGVELVASGKTPDAIKVTQNHARIVSGFVDKGPAQMHEPHARALGGGTDTADTPKAAAADPQKPADAECPECAKPSSPEAKTDCPKGQKSSEKNGPACCERKKQATADTPKNAGKQCCKSKDRTEEEPDNTPQPAE